MCVVIDDDDEYLVLPARRPPMTEWITDTLVTGLPWTQDAACIDSDRRWGIDMLGHPTPQGRALCASCSVSRSCLELALLTQPPPPGLWGGLNRDERVYLVELRKGTMRRLPSRLPSPRPVDELPRPRRGHRRTVAVPVDYPRPLEPAHVPLTRTPRPAHTKRDPISPEFAAQLANAAAWNVRHHAQH